MYRTSPACLLTIRSKRFYGCSHSGGNVSISGGTFFFFFFLKNKTHTNAHSCEWLISQEFSEIGLFQSLKQHLQVKQEEWYSIDSLESQDASTDSRWVARTPVSHQGHTGYLTFARKALCAPSSPSLSVGGCRNESQWLYYAFLKPLDSLALFYTYTYIHACACKINRFY